MASLKILAGKFKGRSLISPTHALRPTSSRVRAAIFNICAHEIEGADFLDLCAGSGAVGFEALSQGAAQVTFVDTHPAAIKAIRSNASVLAVAHQISIQRLEKLKKTFDIIYLDPPYESHLAEELAKIIDQRHLLKKGGLFIIESPKPPPKLENLIILKTKKYGNTNLYLFTW